MIAWRFVLLTSAALALSWSYYALSQERERSVIGGISAAMLAGEAVPDAAASRVLQYLDQRQKPGCSKLLEDQAIIQLYVAAGEQSRGSAVAHSQLSKARSTIRDALACAPYNGYLWYGLYWIENQLGSRQDEVLPFLEFSYEIAPREGWLAYYRSADAVERFATVSPAVQPIVREEYLNAVKEAPALAVKIFKEVKAASRSLLLTWIAAAPLEQRERIATLFDAADLIEDVPGVEYQGGHVSRKAK